MTIRHLRRALALRTLGLGIAVLGVAACQPAGADEAARRLPEAAQPAAESGGLKTATVAGGCFWGVQGVFQHVRGVTRVVSGYAGGAKATANYRAVGTGSTGHAEAVRITYDPAVIRYDEILRIFFSVATDPTQLNRQGPDEGTQYRSAIFPADAGQAKVARAYIAQIDQAKAYGRPVVTTVESGAAFYPAEAYHQDYMALHPNAPYIVANDAPKLDELGRLFPERTSAKPVLLGEARG